MSWTSDPTRWPLCETNTVTFTKDRTGLENAHFWHQQNMVCTSNTGVVVHFRCWKAKRENSNLFNHLFNQMWGKVSLFFKRTQGSETNFRLPRPPSSNWASVAVVPGMKHGHSSFLPHRGHWKDIHLVGTRMSPTGTAHVTPKSWQIPKPQNGPDSSKQWNYITRLGDFFAVRKADFTPQEMYSTLKQDCQSNFGSNFTMTTIRILSESRVENTVVYQMMDGKGWVLRHYQTSGSVVTTTARCFSSFYFFHCTELTFYFCKVMGKMLRSVGH